MVVTGAQAERLLRAVEAVEQAVARYRELGLQAELAASLSNAANRYSDLASLEESRAGRRARLERALETVEESVSLYRELGLQAGLATSLNNAANRYSDLASLEETRAGRRARLRRAVGAIEESIHIRRELGLKADLATSLNNAANRYSDLASLEETRAGRLERLQLAVEAIEESTLLYRELGLQADLATSLNNASSFYGELAGLEDTRAGRLARLERAIGAIEESARIRRKLGLRAELASSLNNAANLYRDLARLEDSRAGRLARLERAVQATDESVALYRDLGLQADLAMSLGTSTLVYRALAVRYIDRQEQILWLGKALHSIEEALEHFRRSGVVLYWSQAVRECVLSYVMLAERTGKLDAGRVLALCEEGEALCRPMEDGEALAFYRKVRQGLERRG